MIKNFTLINMNYKNTKSYKSFMKSPYRSIKSQSYFNVYDHLLEEYVGKDITFVEIGVLDGGSLFMWRDFFGDKARIIGIEINEEAKVWEKHGFEIFTGSQGDLGFWEDFYNEVGKVDVILDDGGHTYRQQILTVECSLKNINPGGKIIIEDTYTSYEREYGYPSNYSFIKYVSNLVDGINLRTPKIKTNKKANKIISNISFFESIVAINFDENLKLLNAKAIYNDGKILGKPAENLRYADNQNFINIFNLVKSIQFLQKLGFLGKLLKKIGILTANILRILTNKKDNFKLRKYFKY